MHNMKLLEEFVEGEVLQVPGNHLYWTPVKTGDPKAGFYQVRKDNGGFVKEAAITDPLTQYRGWTVGIAGRITL